MKNVLYAHPFWYGLLMCCMVAWSGCKTELDSEKALYHWLAQPENGYVQSRVLESLHITVKYLPSKLLIIRELENSQEVTQGLIDSLESHYSQTHTFLMTIKPAPNQTGDVMYQGVGSVSEFKSRVMEMNFHLDAYFSLRLADKEVKPILYSLENTYSTSDQRSLYLVFPAASIENPSNTKGDKNESQSAQGHSVKEGKEKKEPMELVFTDSIFSSGIHHFSFDLQPIILCEDFYQPFFDR
jgi:hypothetical protein